MAMLCLKKQKLQTQEKEKVEKYLQEYKTIPS